MANFKNLTCHEHYIQDHSQKETSPKYPDCCRFSPKTKEGLSEEPPPSLPSSCPPVKRGPGICCRMVRCLGGMGRTGWNKERGNISGLCFHPHGFHALGQCLGGALSSCPSLFHPASLRSQGQCLWPGGKDSPMSQFQRK